MKRQYRCKSFMEFACTAVLFVVLFGGTTAQAATPPPGFDQDAEARLVEVSSVFSVSSAHPGQTYPAAVVVTVAPGWHINSSSPYEDWLIPAKLMFDTIPGLKPFGIEYPRGKDAFLAGDTMSVYDGRTVVRFLLTVDSAAAAGAHQLPVRFTYQPCNNRECRAPQTVRADLQIQIGEEGQPLAPDIFGMAVHQDRPVTALSSPATESDLQRLIDRYGFWGYLLALGVAFVTGLLLSFSPCTYPMIPITVSIFAGQKRTMGRGFVLSLFYVGSMAVVYGIMGLIVSLVGGVFGAWLASPPVVIAIAAVFVVFALSMFGLYELQVPSSLRQKLGTAQAGGGIVGSIVLGVVAALVVSPCVGPFVAGILLYVATHGSPVIGFLVLFVFALGLGTLFVILGTFSSAITALPGAGEWMESVKKFFGFVLLLMALYFLRTILPSTVTALLTGLLLVALGVFGGGLDRLTSESKFFPRVKKLIGLLALVVGLYLLVGTLVTRGLILPPAAEWLPAVGGSERAGEASLIAWETNLENGLDRARREGKPVLIDTWATWCANCRVLEKKTFGNAEVAAEALRFVPLKIQLETAGSPEAKAFMFRFGLKQYSLPTVLLLDSSGKVVRTLQGVVDPQDMLAEMRLVR